MPKTFFKEWRRHCGFTQEELAKAMGLTSITIARIENGERDFTGKYLAAFAETIGCAHIYDPLARPPDTVPMKKEKKVKQRRTYRKGLKKIDKIMSSEMVDGEPS